MLKSLVPLQQGRDVQKSGKVLKTVNIEEKSIYIFWVSWGISIKLYSTANLDYLLTS